MEIEYTLDKNDMLQAKLYWASKNKKLKKTRIKIWLLNTFSMFCLAFVFYVSYKQLHSDYFLSAKYFCLIAGCVSLFFYPLYQRYFYKKFYIKQTLGKDKNYGNPVPASLSFTNETFIIKSKTEEIKTPYSSIKSITETKDYFFIKVRSCLN